MVTGSKRTYVMMMMPSPDASTTIEMDAENIELDPTVITALPMLPSSPDLSSSSELADLRDGLSQLQQLSEGHLKVVDGIVTRMDAYDLSGASKAVAGLTQLQAGLGQMASGASDLATLSQGQVDYLDGVIAGIDTGQFDSLAELQAALGQMKAAASQLKTGAESLVALLDAQIGLVEQLQDSNAALALKATQLADARPGDVGLQDLATGLNGQDARIAALLDGGGLGSGHIPGLRETRTRLDGVASGLADLESGLAQLEAQSASLSAVPQAFEELKAALVVLRDGGVVQGQPFPGLNTTARGLKGIADGLAQTSSGLSGSSATFDEFSSLPAMMDTLTSTLNAVARGGTTDGVKLPGITTTVDGLGKAAGGLKAGVDEMRKGEALLNAMKAAADRYKTFLGLLDGAQGHVSFLFKLDGVSNK